jgi:hypothetical protein
MWCDAVADGNRFYPIVVRSDVSVVDIVGLLKRRVARFDAFILFPFCYAHASAFGHFLAPMSLRRVLFGDHHHPLLDQLTARARFATPFAVHELPGSLVVLPTVDDTAATDEYHIGVLMGTIGPFVFRAYTGDAVRANYCRSTS